MKYFTKEEIIEALEMVVNKKSLNINIELHNIGEVSDTPKSIHFSDGNYNEVFIFSQNFDFEDDPDFIELEMDKEYVKSHINEIAEDIYNEPFNEDEE